MGILFVTLAGHGHVTPTLAVVEELVERGAQVDYATGAEHAEAVTGAGARWVELPAQPAVLKHAEVFISHGGMNSTMEALHQGVPLVVVPQTPEQAANGDRVAELGLGERVDDHADLRAAVERVAHSGTIRQNLDRMRAAVAAGGGAGRAAEVILSRALPAA